MALELEANDYMSEVLRQPRDVFCRAHPSHFLLYEDTATEPEKISIFTTDSISVSRIKAAALSSHPSLPRFHLFPLIKSSRNPWSDRISVGRARNNDVVLFRQSVSKLHAHFFVQGSGLAVCDAGSSNGTRVNDVLLARAVVTAVKSGDVITFGMVATKLLAPGLLYDTFRALA
jgi:hypothetical protein